MLIVCEYQRIILCIKNNSHSPAVRPLLSITLQVHDKLRFDLQLCMDRYLETNREESRRRRKLMGEHKERIKELKGKLEK